MEYFTTSQFMDQVGVKFSTLRYFERIGLLNPEKDYENNYRLYTVRDAFIVNKFKRLRGIGFSAKEALTLLKGVPQDDHSQFRGEEAEELLSVREEELERESFFAVKRLEAIRELREILLSSPAELDFQIRDLPGLYFLPASSGNTFGSSKYNQISQWIDLLPLTIYCRLTAWDDIGREGEPDFGVALEETYIFLLKGKWMQDAVSVPGGKTLEFLSSNLGYPRISADIFHKAASYLDQTPYKPAGPVYFYGLDLNLGNASLQKVRISLVNK